MSIFGLSMFKSKKINGIIGHYNLVDWWLGEFTESDRDYILKIYKSIDEYGTPLITGKCLNSNINIANLFSALACRFNNTENRIIAYKMIKKAEDSIDATNSILDIHFLYQNKLEIYYRNRKNDSYSLFAAVEACKQQIELSGKAKLAFINEYKDTPLPSHKGFEQLAIIEEKNRNYQEVIRLSKNALQQGWNGDWIIRIKRCQDKIK